MSHPSFLATADSPELPCFLDAIVEAGSDLSLRLILADWLEEHDRPREAELLRLNTALVATCCEPDNHPERVQQQARLVELLAAGVRPCLPRRTVALAESVDMTFAWISPGTFLMGSPPDELNRHDDEIQHRVALTRGFYLGIHSVTQTQWQAVMGSNPSYSEDEIAPVDHVSWIDSQKFCKKLSRMEGKRYRLPTEAEWEYACRAGTTTPFFFGENITTDQANYDGDYPYAKNKKGDSWYYASPEGSFPPNAWGLFDMHGNVWEWCADWYGPYDALQTKNPLQTKKGDYSARVLRGGSWYDRATDCRASYRDWHGMSYRIDFVGFRVACRPD